MIDTGGNATPLQTLPPHRVLSQGRVDEQTIERLSVAAWDVLSMSDLDPVGEPEGPVD